MQLAHLSGQTKATPRYPLITPTLPPGETGYSVFIEADGCGTTRGGYQPCRFTIETNPCTPVGADRRFLITVNTFYTEGMVATTPVEIKAGESSGTAELLLSNIAPNSWVNYSIKSKHDGVICRSNFSYQQWASNAYNHGNLMPSTLLVNSGLLEPTVEVHAVTKKDAWEHSSQQLQKKSGRIGLPAIHVAQEAFHHSTLDYSEHDDAFSAVNEWNHVFACRPVDLSNNWAALSNVDHVYISMQDLKAVSRLPGQREALRRWVVAGGTLVVLDPKSKFRNRDRVFPFLIGIDRATMLDTSFDQWTVPSKWLKSLEETIIDTSLIENRWIRDNYLSNDSSFVDISNYDNRPTGRSVTSDDFRDGLAEPFIMQRFTNGLVVLVRTDTSNWNGQDWRYFFNSVRIENIPLSEHLGSGNSSFFEPGFWIPGIGNPPVLAFQILIALFMIVAGPVMLLVLKRTRRMQLLFTLIPLLSIFTCGSLFAYAMLSDGLVTLGRARTFTKIDSRTGDAVTHARASYYKGWQPAPYEFDQGTIVTQNTESRGNLKVRRDQRGSKFRYSGGRIRARSPHQIVSMRTYETQCGLRKVSADDTSDKKSAKEIRFQNKLESDARLIVFRTSDGYFYAKDVRAGTSRSAVANDLPSIASLIKRVHSDHSPKVYNYMQREEKQKILNGETPPRYLGDEHRISKLLSYGKVYSAMPVNSWLAITTSFEPAEQELGDAKMKHMLHFVTGDWQP